MCRLLLTHYHMVLICMQQTSNHPHVFVDITSQLGYKLVSGEETGKASCWVINVVVSRKLNEFPVWLPPLRARHHVQLNISLAICSRK